MSLDALRAQLPAYAKDLRLNLESVLSEAGAQGLEPRQARAVAFASAIASRHAATVAAMETAAAELLSAEEIGGVRAAAAMMAMNNIYYRFTHSVESRDYASLRTGLRMNVMASPGIDKASFELCSMAVSAINGCGACMDSHEKVVRQHGVSAQGVQSAMKIAAVVHAVAVTLEQA